MLTRSLTMKNRNGLACDVLNTLATHDRLLLGTKLQHSGSVFCDFKREFV